MHSCVVDSYEGMRSTIAHLIQAHGFKKNVFMRRPENNPYTQERFFAYRDVLQEAGIPAGRWGTPAGLASYAASYLHGAIIPVDGGWLAR